MSTREEEENQLILKNVRDLDTLWARMSYLGKIAYTVHWEADTPVAYWLEQRLGTVAELNDCSMDHLADILDRARGQAKGENE